MSQFIKWFETSLSLHSISTLLVFFLVVATRWVHRTDTAMWEDEAFRYSIAAGTPQYADLSHQVTWYHEPMDRIDDLGSIGHVLHMLKEQTPYPPLFFVVTHGLMQLGMTKPIDLALWNMLCAGLCGVWLFWIARMSLPASSAFFVGVLYAWSPFDIGVCMQFKELGMACCLSWLATWALLQAMQQGTMSLWLLYGTSLGMALLTHHQCLFWIPIHALILLFSQSWRNQIISWLLSIGLACALVMPWIKYAGAEQYRHLQLVNHLFGGPWHGLAQLPSLLLKSWSAAIFIFAPVGLQHSIVLTLLGLLAMALVLYGLLRWWTDHLIWFEQSSQQPSGVDPFRLLLLAAMIVFGTMACTSFVYLYMQQNQALWERYIVLFLPGCWLMVVAMLEIVLMPWLSLFRQKQKFVLALRASFVAMICLLLFPKPSLPVQIDRYTDWQPIAATLAQVMQPGDALVHMPGHNAFLAFLYAWKDYQIPLRHINLDASDVAIKKEILHPLASERLCIVTSWGFNHHLQDWNVFLLEEGWQSSHQWQVPFIPNEFFRASAFSHLLAQSHHIEIGCFMKQTSDRPS